MQPSRGELLALIVCTVMGRLDKFPGGKRSAILRANGDLADTRYARVAPRDPGASVQLEPIECFRDARVNVARALRCRRHLLSLEHRRVTYGIYSSRGISRLDVN